MRKYQIEVKQEVISPRAIEIFAGDACECRVESFRESKGESGLARFAAFTAGLLLMILAVTLNAQGVRSGASEASVAAARANQSAGLMNDKVALARGDVAQSTLASYLERVRAETRDANPSEGSIWVENGRLAHLSTDVRAMRPHDLISVVVQESLAASTDGTVKNSRASNASSQVSGLIGTLHAGNALQNLINQNSAAGLNASGQSATNSSLSTTLGGQVIEVLGNGMLVIEAARQVTFSQQTQTIVLRGLVRPEDISQSNQILSTSISSLELEVKGKGIINDYTHRQNLLVRMLQKVLVF